MSGGEVGGLREWVLHQHVHRVGSVSNSTSFFYTNWTWRVWWSDDQRVKEPKGKKCWTSDILLRSHADWPRLHGALGTSFWKCLCFFIQRGREQCNTGSLVQWRWSLKILISTTSLMTGDQLILLTKHCRFNADSNKQNLLEIFWCFQPHLTNIWQTYWPKFIWHTKQTI